MKLIGLTLDMRSFHNKKVFADVTKAHGKEMFHTGKLIRRDHRCCPRLRTCPILTQ